MLRLVCHKRRLTTWIMLLSVLFGVLAPAISRIMASENPDLWVEVCTAAGIRFVALSDMAGDVSDDPDTGMQTGDGYCPYCLSHAVSGLPPSGLPVLEPVSLVAFVPAAFLESPRTLFAWISIRSRAPPPYSHPREYA